MSMEKAAGAGLWSALDIVLRQVVQFGASVVLARILNPADFGLIALLGFFTNLSIVFVQGGLTTALVQRQHSGHDEENAVFWTNLIAGSFFALILIAIAPAVSRFYGYPLLNPLMYVAAAQVFLAALGAVQTALLTRTLRFDQLTKTGILSSLASAAAGVAAALAGWGVWALAVQLLTMTSVGTIAVWRVSDWRPAWHVRFASLRGVAGFGVHISLSSTLEVLYQNGFALVIGKVYGASDLGILNRAASVIALPTGIISQVIARTALPLFAARTHDPEALRRGFRMAISLAMLLSMPLTAGLAVLSDLVIVTVFGEKWLPAAPLLAIMALGATMLPLQILNLQLLLAQGGSRTFLTLEIRKKLLGTLFLGIGCFFGITGVATASFLFTFIALYINVRPTKLALNYGIFEQLGDVRGIIAATIFMVAGVYALRQMIEIPSILSLCALIASGGVLYLGFCTLFQVRGFIEALDLFKFLITKTFKKGAQIV